MESSVNDDYFFVSRLRLVEDIFATKESHPTFESIVLEPFTIVLEGRAQTARAHKKSELGGVFAVLRGGVSVFVYTYVLHIV